MALTYTQIVLEKLHLKDFFSIGPMPYYITYVVILVGLGYGLFVDLKVGEPSVITLDIISVVFFVGIHVLVILRVVTRNVGVLVLSVGALIVFWLSGVLQTQNVVYLGHFEGNIMETMLISGLVASILGFAVHRLAAVITIAIGIAFLVYMTLASNNTFLREQLPVTILILLGNLVVVAFFRSALELLMSKLRASFENLELHNHTLKVLKDKAEVANELNHPFVVFGKSTSGLMHDLKNDVNILSIRTQVLEMKLKRGRSLDLEDVEELTKAVKRMDDRITIARFLGNASQEKPFEMLSCQSLLEAALYPFKISPNFRNRINFTSVSEASIQIFSSRFHLLRILENLIQNACEALLDRAELDGRSDGYAGSVDIHASWVNGVVTLSVSDDGPGMNFCDDCEADNCLDCAQFTIGKTTKAYGSGYGMVNVLNAVGAIGGTMEIFSGSGLGTKVNVLIPVREPTRSLEETGVIAQGERNV